MSYTEIVDCIGCSDVRFILGTGRRRLQGHQQWAADSREGGDRPTDGAVHRRNDSQRPERLAIDWRPGNWHDLGTRRLRRARLERRLSSPTVGNRLESLGEAAGLCGLFNGCQQNRAPGCKRASPKLRDTIPTIPSTDTIVLDARPCCGLRGTRSLLRGHIR